MLRRWEFREGRSSKFWQLSVRGKDVTVVFGRIGTLGQTKTKTHASAEAAKKEAEALVREKEKKGYREVPLEAAVPKAKAPRAKTGAALASIASLWERLEVVRAKKFPQLDLQLRPGASEKQISAAEKALGIRFPADFRESLKLHDGQANDCQVVWMRGAQRLGSLESLVACWKDDRKYFDDTQLKERADWYDTSNRVRQIHLHPRQVPFAGSPYWDYDRLLFDFAPGPVGTEGQVIARQDVEFKWVAATFTELLERTVRELETGKNKMWVP